jgi:hypothetical protein
MANCIVHPIPTVESRMNKSLMTYRMNFGQTICPIGYVWYILLACTRMSSRPTIALFESRIWLTS